MHPVRRAANTWKAANPTKTDADFARFLGYSDVDILYKQIRGEYIPRQERLRKMAEVLGWTAGRFLNACIAHLNGKRRTA